MITQLVRKQIREMQEINWGEIPDNTGMRLLWGENQNLINVCKKAIEKESEKINLYPSPTKKILREELAQYNNVDPKNVVPTNGSDEAIELIAKVFIAENDEAVIPVPSFPCYASVSQMMGAKILTLPLENDFSLSVDKLLNLVTDRTKVIWIANPNNPTGNLLLNEKQVKDIAKQVNCLLIIDECYFELGGITAASLIESCPNVIVLRSFSKVFAMAGARLGYILCNQEVAKYLNTLQMSNQPFSVNRFAQAAAVAILRQPLLIEKSVSRFLQLKKGFENKLNEVAELEVLETKTSFSLVKVASSITGAQLKEKLKEENIFIKDCSIYEGFGKQYIYLGIPLKEYQDKAVEAIRTVLKEK